ncbi:MAG: right-handed parallel beta-helix repeat-containing protein, partial [Methanobacteriota archaeon]
GLAIFDNGFRRPDENPAGDDSGVAVDGVNGIYKNILAFDNAFDYDWNPTSSTRDFRAGSTTNLDADYNYVKDGQYMQYQGQHSMSETDPTRRDRQDSGYLVFDKELARDLAREYLAASRAGTATWEMRQQFMQAMANALKPAPGSPLIDAGGFLLHTTSASSGNVIQVDKNPWRFFRAGIPEIGVEGDVIQIDDMDGNPDTKILARIVGMTENSITLNTSVNVLAGAGIALPYEGNAPDIGAYEYTPEVEQRLIYVDDDNCNTGNGQQGSTTNPYCTINDAISVVSPGDKIIVRPGTYPSFQLRGNLNSVGEFGQPIIIQSENWYPRIAHDRAIDVVVDGAGGQFAGAITDGERYVILRGLILENADHGLLVGNSDHLIIEDVELRNNNVRGITMTGSSGEVKDSIIRRCVIHDNADSGLHLRGSNFGVSNILVEDCDSYNNGFGVPHNGQGFAVRTPAKNIVFRNLLAFNDLSSNFAAVDPINWTVDNSIGWNTTRLISGTEIGDGRNFVAGLHSGGTGTILRKSVGFDSPSRAVTVTNSPQASVYGMTVFDSG